MAMNDYLKEKLKSFARDNLGVKSWKEQVDENFANGEEVALMKGFTRAAQNQFIKDLVKKAVDTTKPKKDIGGRKIREYKVMFPDQVGGYEGKDGMGLGSMSANYFDDLKKRWDAGEKEIWIGGGKYFNPSDWEPRPLEKSFTPAQFKKLGIPETSLRVRKVFDGNKPNTLTPKQTAPEASEELEKAIMIMPENIQDAYLYGQRNLDDYSHLRKKGEMNSIYPGASRYEANNSNMMPGWDEHSVHIETNQDIEPFVNDVLHEGGHRTDSGVIGRDDYSVERNLGKYIRKELIDEIANSDNPRQMIEELSGGNKAIKRLLADGVSMHPEIRNPGSLQYRHPKAYMERWQNIYNKSLPDNVIGRESAAANGPVASEGFAEIMGILGTPGGYEWMQKNAPATLRRFERINEASRIKAERALGPDGAVPERYNVNFHPELGD